jgi:hypothetical protein
LHLKKPHTHPALHANTPPTSTTTTTNNNTIIVNISSFAVASRAPQAR